MTYSSLNAINPGSSADPYFSSTGTLQSLGLFGRIRLGAGSQHSNATDNNLTSSTSVVVGTGSKTFAATISDTSPTSPWAVGTEVQVFASETVWMIGLVTALSGTSITINVTETSGSGTYASWYLNTVTRGSWLQCFTVPATGNVITGWDYTEDLARLSVVNDFGVAINAASRTSGSSTLAAIALTAMVLNDSGSGLDAHAIYFDAVRAHAAAGDTFGAEGNAATMTAITPPTPYSETAGEGVAVLRLAAGSDNTIFGDSYAIGTGIHFVSNLAKMHSVITVEYDVALRDDEADTPGVSLGTGYGRFAALPYNVGLSWWSSNPVTTPGTQSEVARLTSIVTDPTINWRVQFTDTAFVIGDNVSPTYNALSVGYNASAEAGISITPGPSAGAPILGVNGAATDISLRFQAKGAGLLEFEAPMQIENTITLQAAATLEVNSPSEFKDDVLIGTGAWNGGALLRLGAYRIWVDSTGDLRIKSGAPASDTDGTVVGTQT